MPAFTAPELTDGVVTLRAHRPQDAAAVVEACRDPDIQYWLPRIPREYSPSDFQAWRLECERARDEGRALNLLVFEGERLVGSVGLNDVIETGGHIGYWIAPGARGRGHAARAVRLLRDWLHDEHGFERLEILAHPANRRSQRVAAAAGFSATGEYRRPPDGGIDGMDYMVFAWPDDAAAGAGAG